MDLPDLRTLICTDEARVLLFNVHATAPISKLAYVNASPPHAALYSLNFSLRRVPNNLGVFL